MTTPRAELILYNGTIHTLNSHQPAVEAVAVANGRITVVGSSDAVEATAHTNTRRFDLAGRTLLPGFNDVLYQLSKLSNSDDVASSDERTIMQVARQYNRIGITSVSIMAATPDILDNFRVLAAERRLPLRINAIAARYTLDGIKLSLPQRFESNWLRIDTVWLTAESEGALAVSDDKLRAMVWDIHRAGLRAMIRASSEAAIEQAIRAIEYASGRLASRLHHCIESFMNANEMHMQRCREHRINIVVRPENNSAQLRQLLDSDVVVGIGSENGLQPHTSPLSLVKSTVSHVGVPDAVALYTLGNAAVAGEDQLKGSISIGKYADFVVLSGDPFRAPVERLDDLQAEVTIMNGQIVHST
jgi:predicted amidohydrolase YtcJ